MLFLQTLAPGPCLSSLGLREPTGSRVAKIDPRKTLNAEVLVRKGSPVMVCMLRITLSSQVPGRNLWEFSTVEKGAVANVPLQSQGL